MTDFMQAWKIKESDFPKDGKPADILSFCVGYAVLAPSPYNVQPWFFKVQGNVLKLYIDRRHALPVIDPDDRALSLCCGAALYNLRLALSYFGYQETTEILPDPEDEDLVAQVTLGEKMGSQGGHPDLFTCVPKRHVNRGAFADKEVPQDVLQRLEAVTAEEGAWLHIATPAERRVIIGMIIEADAIQSADKSFRREIASWITPQRAYSGDGMPGYEFSFSQIMNTKASLIVRRFEDSNHKPVEDEVLDDASPVIAIVGSKASGQLERVNTGQALMRMLLEAEKQGLSVSPLNQPLEIPDLRLRLHEEIEHVGRSQMILRLGYGGKPIFHPRRSMDMVLDRGGRNAPANQNASQSPKGGWLRKILAK